MSSADAKAIVAGGEDGGGAGVSLGKGAWDCDTNTEIPPEKEAYVFEEIATMDFPFEGIPTVPPRKDMDHLAFFCGGCRYRVTAYPDWTAAKVRQLHAPTVVGNWRPMLLTLLVRRAGETGAVQRRNRAIQQARRRQEHARHFQVGGRRTRVRWPAHAG